MLIGQDERPRLLQLTTEVIKFGHGLKVIYSEACNLRSTTSNEKSCKRRVRHAIARKPRATIEDRRRGRSVEAFSQQPIYRSVKASLQDCAISSGTYCKSLSSDQPPLQRMLRELYGRRDVNFSGVMTSAAASIRPTVSEKSIFQCREIRMWPEKSCFFVK